MARGRRLKRVRPEEPQRRCIACRTQRTKAELLRIAARDGKAVADPGAVLPGRGAYLCRSENCAAKAAKARAIGRALKGKAAEPGLPDLLAWVVVPAREGSR